MVIFMHIVTVKPDENLDLVDLTNQMKGIPDTEDEIFIQAPSSTLNFLFQLTPPQARALHLHGYYTQYLSEITETGVAE